MATGQLDSYMKPAAAALDTDTGCVRSATATTAAAALPASGGDAWSRSGAPQTLLVAHMWQVAVLLRS